MEKIKNLRKVSFCGNFGDPLMHPNLNDIVAFFQNQHISISTNASLRSQQWWSDLGRNKNVSVTFCIDGIGQTRMLYRRNTSYEKIIENAKSFIQAGGTAHWQFIVFRHNEHQVNEAKKLSEELGFKTIDIMYSDRFDTDNTWKVYDHKVYQYDLEKASHQTTLRESLNAHEGEKYWKWLNKNKGAITCVWSQERKLYIHSDGTVYPCCMLGSIQAGKHIEKLMLKKLVKDFHQIDLYHNNLEQILTSEVFQTALPNSFKGDPFSHPICIEWCNKSTGKYYKKNNNSL
jgi:sulfatase maturation enzyme AslB (radical SAM superfamily)